MSWQAVLPGGTLGRSRGNRVGDRGCVAGHPPPLPAPQEGAEGGGGRASPTLPPTGCHLKHRQDQGRARRRHHHLRGDLSCPGSRWVPVDPEDPVGGREKPRSAAEGLSPQPCSTQTLSPHSVPSWGAFAGGHPSVVHQPPLTYLLSHCAGGPVMARISLGRQKQAEGSSKDPHPPHCPTSDPLPAPTAKEP